MARGTILVVGGTGMLGAPVARRLAAEGYAVRVLTRNARRARTTLAAPITLAAGDVADAASIERAMEGCAGVHINLDGHGDWSLEPRGAAVVAAAAARLRLRRITCISGTTACEANARFPMARAKLDAERAVRDSGVPFTIFRCSMFMETLPLLVRGGRAIIMGSQPAPWRWLAASDYAAMVARAFVTGAARDKTLVVFGPEPWTMEAALERYRSVCVPEAKLTRIPFWVLSLMALAPGRSELRRHGLPMMRYFSQVREAGDPAEADALLGTPATTLEAWCRRRATAPADLR